VKSLIKVKSKKVGIIKDVDLLKIARKIDEGKKKVKSCNKETASADADTESEANAQEQNCLQLACN
jgi:hypothetical protein